MKNIDRALKKIAIGNSIGVVSDDSLIKACEAYKDNFDGFYDSYEYELYVSKSLFDSLSGITTDKEISKAVVVGQTKSVDGIVYIYTATPNAKTPYDWRVLKNSLIIGRQVDDDKVDAKQVHVNDLFPKDISSLKLISKLGGSTGAQLMEDDKGNRYVMKQGKNTTNEHVISEYKANQLYDLLGLRVPDYELYDDVNNHVLLSRFIPMTKIPNSSHHSLMAKGIIADVLLSNFDVYQNDNCLIDSADRIIRVDNGGCLDFRTQGANKQYDGDVLKTFKDMKKHNSSVFGKVTDDELLLQIEEILKKKDDILNYMIVENSNNPMINIIRQRFDNLPKIAAELNRNKVINNKAVVARTLKSSKDMYRTFTEDEEDEFWSKMGKGSAYSKLKRVDKQVGWELLSYICKERGFDARPRVVEEDEYWNIVAKSKHPQSFRGLNDDTNFSAQVLAQFFKHEDSCYFGQYGIYGSGIYAHCNDGNNNKNNTKDKHTSSDAYYHALNTYAGGKDTGVMRLAFEDDMKIAVVDDLIKEIKANPPVNNTAVVKPLKVELDAIKSEINLEKGNLSNISQKTIDDVYADLHYDEYSITDMQLSIDNTDWGALDDNGEPDYPSWFDFVEGKMSAWVVLNGGKVQGDKDGIVFTLPNSKVKFPLAKTTYEHNAIKQKNSFSNPYNYPVKRFQDWVMSQHVVKVEVAKDKAIEELGSVITDLKKVINDLETKYTDKENEIKKFSNPDPDADIYSGIYSLVTNGDKEAVGVYAALKGYDALFQANGNNGKNGFYAILNRSKVIVMK